MHLSRLRFQQPGASDEHPVIQGLWVAYVSRILVKTFFWRLSGRFSPYLVVRQHVWFPTRPWEADFIFAATRCRKTASVSHPEGGKRVGSAGSEIDRSCVSLRCPRRIEPRGLSSDTGVRGGTESRPEPIRLLRMTRHADDLRSCSASWMPANAFDAILNGFRARSSQCSTFRPATQQHDSTSPERLNDAGQCGGRRSHDSRLFAPPDACITVPGTLNSGLRNFPPVLEIGRRLGYLARAPCSMNLESVPRRRVAARLSRFPITGGIS